MPSQKQPADAVADTTAESCAATDTISSSDIGASTTQNELLPVKYDYADSFACTYIISVISAWNAELVTYPFDLLKTRLQIQGESLAQTNHVAGKVKAQVKYRGMIATAIGIVKEEGPLKLWQGLTPGLYRHIVYSGVRVCTYDYLRKVMAKNEVGKDNYLPLWKATICGVMAGGIAQWLASPADLVKVQIQMEGKRRLMGEEPRVHGVRHAFKEIVRRGGVKGLWKGSVPNVQRAALVAIGDMTTYDSIKHMIMRRLHMPDCRTVQVLASICAGFVATVMATPADVVKTRVMNQPTDDKGRGILYKGSLDCLRQTVTKEGFGALYKGFLPCWIRMAPWALTFWLSFEQIRSWLGASGY